MAKMKSWLCQPEVVERMFCQWALFVAGVTLWNLAA